MTGGEDRSAFGADSRWTAAGPLGAPLVVLIHPTRMNRTFWTPQVDALASSLRVVAVDLPGHGQLEHERFTLPAAVELVRAAIEAQHVPDLGPGTGAAPSAPTVLVGSSLGGYVAMAVGAELPATVDALVVVGATAEPTGPRAHPFRALAAAYQRAGPVRLDRVDRSMIRRRYPGGVGDLIVASGLAYRGGSEALRSLAGEAFLPRLARFPGPVILVNGSGDVAMRPGEQGFLAAARRGRLVHLRGAYHLASLDRPAQFSAIVRSAVADAVEARRRAGAAGVYGLG